MKIDAKAPRYSRSMIQFGEDPPGLFITGAKCRIDAINFRSAAEFLKQSGEERIRNHGLWLETLAGQFEAAAAGGAPKAPVHKPETPQPDPSDYPAVKADG